MQETRPEQRLRVCFFGTYRERYVRNEVAIAGLRSQGVDVVECHSTLWRGVADRVEQAGGGWKHPGFFLRVLRTYLRLLKRYRQVGQYDVMLVGYPGQFDSVLAWLLTRLRGKRMALDILMSLHLIAEERGLVERSPLTGRLIFWLEKVGLHLPDLLIADTAEYRRYYAEKYNLPQERFRLVPLGVDDRLYKPRPHLQPPREHVRIIYYGTFIPLHGVETMLRAAADLRDHPQICFDFFGEGQELPRMKALAQSLQLENVRFRGWVDKTKLPDEIATSHICLGVFGTTKQSICTIQNKIWEGMMMERPVITGDAPTIRAELTHKEHVYLVERANPRALAEGIMELAARPDLRRRLGEAGHRRAQQNTIEATGRRLHELLQALQAGV